MAGERLIITAASESYSAQLLAMLGSLRCNWPDHPKVLVYDLGLSEATQKAVTSGGFAVRRVPAFVPHWRQHYTWKLWCMHDAPAEQVLWLDAGCCILKPSPELFDIVSAQGYFLLPNYRPLALEASEAACEGSGVSSDYREGKVTVTAGVVGFRRGSAAETAVEEAYVAGQTERFIKATRTEHRWEQALLSLQFYKHLCPLVLCDAGTYFSEDLRAGFTTHSIWAARRNMNFQDRRYFAASLAGGPSHPRLPGSSHKVTLWYRLAWQLKVLLDRLKGLFSKGEQFQKSILR